LQYQRIEPRSREELESAFASGDSSRIIEALLSATYHDEDWRWVQGKALGYLRSPDHSVRHIAVQSLGLIAVLHQQLDTTTVVPVLMEATLDPELRGEVEDAIADIYSRIPSARPS
jgi:hypothetical protein